MFGVEAGSVLRSQQERVWVGGGGREEEEEARVGGWSDLICTTLLQPGLAWPGRPRSEILNFCRSFDLERVGGGRARSHNIATDASPGPPGLSSLSGSQTRPGTNPAPDRGDAPSNAQTNCPAETCLLWLFCSGESVVSVCRSVWSRRDACAVTRYSRSIRPGRTGLRLVC